LRLGRTNSTRGCRRPRPTCANIHPNIGDIYRRRIERLTEALGHPDDAREAAEALREVIDRIVITPGEKRGDLQVTLQGDLGTILDWVAPAAKSGYKATPEAASARLSVSVNGRACPGHPRRRPRCREALHHPPATAIKTIPALARAPAVVPDHLQ